MNSVREAYDEGYAFGLSYAEADLRNNAPCGGIADDLVADAVEARDDRYRSWRAFKLGIARGYRMAVRSARVRSAMKYAVIYANYPSDKPAQVEAYLPANYHLIPSTLTHTPDGKWRVGIEGEDVAGWTLEGYVIPRLASGLYTADVCRDIEHVRDRTTGVMN